MRRRDLLALLTAAAAAPGAALADVKTIPIDKAFPFLVGYLALPPAQRSLFYLAYRAMRDKHPTADAHATIIAPNGARTPVAFDRLGNVLRLPSLPVLKSGATVQIDGAPFQMGLELRCAAAPSTHIDVGELVASLTQVNAAVARVAGALSFAVPKLTAAYFPDGAAGQAVMSDGRTAPLPVVAVPVIGPVPYLEPASLAGVRSVVFAKAPSRILLGGHPKKT
jgi:hypothetical protein